MPADLTVGQFVYVIRKRIKLSPEKAIFIFVDEVLPPTAALMSSIYEEHKDEDGFLYITYVCFHESHLVTLYLPVTIDTLARTPLAQTPLRCRVLDEAAGRSAMLEIAGVWETGRNS